MKIKLVYVFYLVAALGIIGITAFTTTKIVKKNVSAAKDREFAKIEKMYEKQQKSDKEVTERYATAYETLAKEARYKIENTYSKNKNKNGEMYFIPTSTMEIDNLLETLDEKIKPVVTVKVDTVMVDSSKVDTIKRSWLYKLFHN
jgi:hypothetical protein